MEQVESQEPPSPKRGLRTGWIVAFALIVVAVFLWAISPVFITQNYGKSACIAHIKQSVMAEMMYAGDHDDRCPDALVWMDRSLPYARTIGLFRCPDIEQKPAVFGFSMYVALSGAILDEVAQPDEQILLFDSVNTDWNACSGLNGFRYESRDHVGTTLAFADGHARRMDVRTLGYPKGPDPNVKAYSAETLN